MLLRLSSEGDLLAYLEGDVAGGSRERGRVRIDVDELYALGGPDHAGNDVVAGAAYADDLYFDDVR